MVAARLLRISYSITLHGSDLLLRPTFLDVKLQHCAICFAVSEFNRNYLIRSYQNIGNLNFFETPMPAPETRPSGDQGDVDIVFNVKEKRTGNVNFGASMGQGTGLGGFIGLDQPNLLGRCKRAQLQWQFGRYLNDFNATYSDPNIRQSRISGSFSWSLSTQSHARSPAETKMHLMTWALSCDLSIGSETSCIATSQLCTTSVRTPPGALEATPRFIAR